MSRILINELNIVFILLTNFYLKGLNHEYKETDRKFRKFKHFGN